MSTPTLSAPTSSIFKIRTFTDGDYGAAADLIVQHDKETIGSSNVTAEFLREDWQMVNFDPTADIAVAEMADGTLGGIVICFAIRPIPVRPMLWVGVGHVDARESIADALIVWGLRRAQDVLARVPDHACIVAESHVHHEYNVVSDALERAGFTTERGAYTMLIDLAAPTPAPVFPEDLRLVSFAERPDLALFATALNAAFADHRGSNPDQPLSFSIARYEKDTKRTDFDPTAWWLVMDGDQPAAICTTFGEAEEFPNTAYIHQLGTLPAYRKRGVALALLHHAFAEFRRRGKSGVSLGVDGSSLTNAVALYQRAGMHIAAKYDAYELEIRPGTEITRQ